MITFLTTYKPFIGDDAIRQRNSLLSWFALHPDVEVMVFGTPAAPAEIPACFDAKHFPEQDWNGTGMPRIDQMFEFAQATARHDLISYVNGDIVLGKDYLEALLAIPFEKFLMVGERWETNYLEPITKGDPSCLIEYRRAVKAEHGYSAGPCAMDYFGFRRGSIGEISPLVPGAVLWDNFMVNYFRRRALPVIDATRDVFAIHQTHGYQRTACQARVLDEGPAARNNRQLLKALDPYCIHTPATTRDATLILQNGRLHAAWRSPAVIIHRAHAVLLRGLRKAGLYSVAMRLIGRTTQKTPPF